MVKHERPYKVARAFERHDGKALRKYARGSIISAKDAAKMDINNPKKYPRGNPLQVLIASGTIYEMPAGTPDPTPAPEKTAPQEVSIDAKPQSV
jgi:hypothetical protein